MKHLLFTGGGSAGHVVPNLAIMRELRYVFRITYMGTGGIEERLVKEAGYPFFRVDCPKLVRAVTVKNLAIPFSLRRAVKRAEDILRREKPDLIFSKGGFASFPAARAGQKLGIPVFTHESDLSPGLCTRLIARRCERVLTSFRETAERFPNGCFSGPPVRRELFGCDRGRALHKFGLDGKKPVLLVFGGGSGSRALSEALLRARPALSEKFSILHITGKDGAPMSQGDYLAIPYLSDMGSAYAAADLVLSRAGSNTLFELLALKKRAVVVPLARSSRGDQLENARYFEKKGLLRVLPEEELDRLPEVLTETLTDLMLGDALAHAEYGSGTQCIVELLHSRLQEGGVSE